jgi:hypothetical protein
MPERRDNPAFEFAAATTPAPLPDDTPMSVASVAAWMTRQALRLVADSAKTPRDLWYCVMRASGMSMEAIGVRDGGKSRQAVHKRLARICKGSDALSAWLGLDMPQDEYVAGPEDVTTMETRQARERRELCRFLRKRS